MQDPQLPSSTGALKERHGKRVHKIGMDGQGGGRAINKIGMDGQGGGRAIKTVLPPEYRKDPEALFLADVEQMLRTVNLHSMLDVGCSLSGHMSQLFGSKFERVVILATNATSLDEQKANLAHPHATFVLSDIVTFAKQSHEKFEVVFLNMVLQELPTYDVDPTIRALEVLLNDEGIGVISTTHVEEGRGAFHLSTGDVVKEDTFNKLTDFPPGVSRVRRWTTSELMQQVRGKSWEVTSHAIFTYFTERYARQSWEQQDRFLNRSLNDVRSTPVAQLVAVRRFVTAFSAKFAPPLKPSSVGVKDVVFALVRGGSYRIDYNEFVQSRKCLRKALNETGSLNQPAFDEVVFHEGNVPDHFQRSLSEEWARVRFVDIRSYGAFGGLGNGSAGGIFRWKPWVRLRRPAEYNVGYRHMCRFMAMLWMNALSKYEYAMRVDDDVCIHQMLHPFRFLRESHVDYAYGLATIEKHAETVATLSPWLRTYVKDHCITPNIGLDASRMYFTNLFVTNVSWWLRDSVRLFLHTVDRSGNIYNHRWGDAPLQTAALHMFAVPHRVQWLRVDYSHLSTLNEVKNGSEVPFVEVTIATNKQKLASKFNEPLSRKKFTEDWNLYIAPCLVADYFNLTGSPFKSHIRAVRALQNVIRLRAKAENVDVEKYRPEELAYVVQVDFYGSSQPLPTDEVQGATRRNAMVRLVSGSDRQHPEDKDFTFEERTSLNQHPCFEGFHSVMRVFDQLQTDSKVVSSRAFLEKWNALMKKKPG